MSLFFLVMHHTKTGGFWEAKERRTHRSQRSGPSCFSLNRLGGVKKSFTHLFPVQVPFFNRLDGSVGCLDTLKTSHVTAFGCSGKYCLCALFTSGKWLDKYLSQKKSGGGEGIWNAKSVRNHGETPSVNVASSCLNQSYLRAVLKRRTTSSSSPENNHTLFFSPILFPQSRTWIHHPTPCVYMPILFPSPGVATERRLETSKSKHSSNKLSRWTQDQS